VRKVALPSSAKSVPHGPLSPEHEPRDAVTVPLGQNQRVTTHECILFSTVYREESDSSLYIISLHTLRTSSNRKSFSFMTISSLLNST
jgi:hypothetical protein